MTATALFFVTEPPEASVETSLKELRPELRQALERNRLSIHCIGIREMINDPLELLGLASELQNNIGGRCAIYFTRHDPVSPFKSVAVLRQDRTFRFFMF